MTGTNTLTMKALESVTGGKKNVVHNPHKGYAYVNCRKRPGLNEPVLLKIPNGETVFPTGKRVKKDGFTWVQINLAGGYDYGWVAAHLIGY